MSVRSLDIVVTPVEGQENVVMVFSGAMRCEFPVKLPDLGDTLANLYREWNDLVEADII